MIFKRLDHRRVLHDPTIPGWQELPVTPRQRGRIIDLGHRSFALDVQTQGEADAFLAEREPADEGDCETLGCFGIKDPSRLTRATARKHVKALMSLPKYQQAWAAQEERRAREAAARKAQAEAADAREAQLGAELGVLIYLARCDGGIRTAEKNVLCDYAQQAAADHHCHLADQDEFWRRLKDIVVTHPMFLELVSDLADAALADRQRVLAGALRMVMADKRVHAREKEALDELSAAFDLPMPPLEAEAPEDEALVTLKLVELRHA